MVLWIVMAVLAAAASLPVLVPLFRASRLQPMANAAGSIYRDQLDEVERDRARGLIADQEAEAARTETARRLLETAYGEALTRANGDRVTKEARVAFEQGNKLDPQAIGPRFFLALSLTQEGKKDEAIAAWHKLLEGAPADAAWVQMGRNALASL